MRSNTGKVTSGSHWCTIRKRRFGRNIRISLGCNSNDIQLSVGWREPMGQIYGKSMGGRKVGKACLYKVVLFACIVQPTIPQFTSMQLSSSAVRKTKRKRGESNAILSRPSKKNLGESSYGLQEGKQYNNTIG